MALKCVFQTIRTTMQTWARGHADLLPMNFIFGSLSTEYANFSLDILGQKMTHPHEKKFHPPLKSLQPMSD